MFTSLLIDSLFLLCPMSELPLLERSARLDMLDYYEARMEARGTNRMGGSSILTSKSDSLLTIQLTEVSSWSMELMKDGSIRTTHKIQTSDIPERKTTHYYNKEWKSLKRKKR